MKKYFLSFFILIVLICASVKYSYSNEFGEYTFNYGSYSWTPSDYSLTDYEYSSYENFWVHYYSEICSSTSGLETHVGEDYNLGGPGNSEADVRNYGFGRFQSINNNNSIVIKNLLDCGETVYFKLLHMTNIPDIIRDQPFDGLFVRDQILGMEGMVGTDAYHLHVEVGNDYDPIYPSLCISSSHAVPHAALSVESAIYVDSLLAHYSDVNTSSYVLHPQAVIGNYKELLPYFSRSNSFPDSNDYDVFGVSGQNIYGSFYIQRIQSDMTFDDIGIRYSEYDDSGTNILFNTNEVTVPLGSTGIINGNNQLNEGDYNFFAYSTQFGQGYPVHFSILGDLNSRIVDNDQIAAYTGANDCDNEEGPCYTCNAVDVNTEIEALPGYYLTSKRIKGGSDIYAKWYPNRKGVYDVEIFIPENVTATNVAYKAVSNSVTAPSYFSINQAANADTWATAGTFFFDNIPNSSSSYKGYVGLYAGDEDPLAPPGNQNSDSSVWIGIDAVKFNFNPVGLYDDTTNGWHEDGSSQDILDAFVRNGGIDSLGYPCDHNSGTEYVHSIVVWVNDSHWEVFYLQDFSPSPDCGANETPQTTICYTPEFGAYLLEGCIGNLWWQDVPKSSYPVKKYQQLLGAPVSDEGNDLSQFPKTITDEGFTTAQEFEYGWVLWKLNTIRLIMKNQTVCEDYCGNISNCGTQPVQSESGLSSIIESASSSSLPTCSELGSSSMPHIAGIVRYDGVGLAGVKMNGLPGDPETGGSGGYLVYVPEGWSGTVTPEKAGYAFTPSSISYSNVTSDQTGQNYTATVSYHTISGQVKYNTTGISGAIMSGLPNTPTTDANGYYSDTVPNNWTGTVLPQKAGYSFQSKYYSIVTSDKENQNYYADIDRLTISGNVSDSGGTGIEGVVMYGLPGQPTSNSSGDYNCYVDYGWSGTVRPQKTGYYFTPESKTYSNLTVSKNGEDFTASDYAFTISGQITIDGLGLSGVVMNGLPGNPTTDSSGQYSATVPFHWTGSVTPLKNGYIITPSPRNYVSVGMNYAEENYSARIEMITISGTITNNSAGFSGVSLTGLPGGIVTDTNGFYSSVVPYGWSGTVTPYKQGYGFNPVELSYSNIATDYYGQDYSASEQAPCSNRIYFVSDSTELNDAIQQLSNNPGIIVVPPGTYNDINLDLESNCSLISTGGADQTTLNLSSYGSFGNAATNITIDGFTILNNQSTVLNVIGDNNIQIKNCIFDPIDKGIEIDGSSGITLEGNVFLNNNGATASVWVAFGDAAGDITFRNNKFVANSIGVKVGSNDGLDVFFENNYFVDCTIQGIDVDNISSVTLKNNIFENNTTGVNLGEVTSTIQAYQNTFANNALGIEVTSATEIFNNIFYHNTKGINCDDSGATISVHHHMENDTSPYYGPGYYIWDDPTIYADTDPLFVDALNGDFHLAAGSPAKNVGQGGVDLGAYGGDRGDDWIEPPGVPSPPPSTTGVTIEGDTSTNVDDTLSLNALGAFSGGYCGYINSQASWSSSNASVLEHQGDGVFVAHLPGNATVTATYDGYEDQHVVTVEMPALGISKSDNQDPVPPDSELVYTINYQNTGSVPATNVVITENYDSGVAFTSANPAPDTGTNNVWTLGELLPGASGTITINVQTGSGLTEGSQLSNTASIDADYIDPVQATELTTIGGTSNLTISKSCNLSQAQPGYQLVYTISYGNNGTGTAHGVIITESYDANTTFVESNPAPTSSNNIWSIGDIASGGSGSITITVLVSESIGTETTLTNNVSIVSDENLSVEDSASTNVVLPLFNLDLTVNGNGSVSSSPAGLSNCRLQCNADFSLGTTVTVTAVPDAGWDFKNWTGDINGSSDSDSIIMDGNKNITAVFELETHTITALTNTGGSISPSGSVGVQHSGSQAFTIQADAGYDIYNVIIDGYSAGPLSFYVFTNVTTDHSIWVNFSSFANLIDWNGNLVADFGDNGLWYNDGTSWNWMSNSGHVGEMEVWDGKLVVDFGTGKGMYYYDTSWHWMTNNNSPNLMIAAILTPPPLPRPPACI